MKLIDELLRCNLRFVFIGDLNTNPVDCAPVFVAGHDSKRSVILQLFRLGLKELMKLDNRVTRVRTKD